MLKQPMLSTERPVHSFKVYTILVFCVTCYASSFVFGALLVDVFHPVALAFLRLVFINIFLLFVGWRFMMRAKIAFHLLLVLALAGFIGISLSHWSMYTGLMYTDPITAALIYALGPLLTSLITYIYLKERRKVYFWIGIVISFFGVSLVVSEGGAFTLHIGKGEGLIGVTILTYSIYLVLVEYLSKHLKPMIITVYTSLFGLILFFPFLRLEHFQKVTHIDLNYWLLLIGTAILTNGICTILWNGAVRKVGASASSLFLNMEPFAAMVIGYIVLHQIVQPIQLIGSFFIITGVIMGTRAGRKEQLNKQVS
ncbi:DMT family transporter [Virgibacillus sp. W0430]|uniref:DMT family transporter n=1 Tax=Virgibacillus sp. W0430 TaxID=3391580 RepID=UPI003F45A031